MLVRARSLYHLSHIALQCVACSAGRRALRQPSRPTMLALFSNIQSTFDLSKHLGKLNIDNGALKLQYRVTGPLLFAACIIVTAQQFIGDRISCIQSAGAIPENVLNTYCFFIGTTTWLNNTNSMYPHRGIGPEQEDALSIRHLYYQWVSYYLFFLALIFHSTHYLWKGLERQRLARIVAGMEHLKFSLMDKEVNNIPSLAEKDKRIDALAKNLWCRVKSDLNNDWTIKLIICEAFAFLLVLFVFWMTDAFLGGGGNFTSMTMDKAEMIFRTETSCIFYKYGPSGTIQRHDALCILATNIVNIYIFYAFYVWMLILIIISSLALLWRVVGFFFFRTDWFNKITPSNHIVSLVPPDSRRTVFKTLNYCDWVFLNYVAENTSSVIYAEVFIRVGELIKSDYGVNEMLDYEEEEEPFAKHQD